MKIKTLLEALAYLLFLIQSGSRTVGPDTSKKYCMCILDYLIECVVNKANQNLSPVDFTVTVCEHGVKYHVWGGVCRLK